MIKGVQVIITSLLALLLMVISAISLSNAKNNLSLTEMAIKSNYEYYKADKSAIKVVADMLNGGEPVAANIYNNGDGTRNIEYTISINEYSELYVMLHNSDGKYEVINWNTITKLDDAN